MTSFAGMMNWRILFLFVWFQNLIACEFHSTFMVVKEFSKKIQFFLPLNVQSYSCCYLSFILTLCVTLIWKDLKGKKITISSSSRFIYSRLRNIINNLPGLLNRNHKKHNLESDHHNSQHHLVNIGTTMEVKK